MYVTKHLSCAISVTNALINLAFVAGAKRGGRGGRTPATQATINSEMTNHPPTPTFPARSFVNSVPWDRRLLNNV